MSAYPSKSTVDELLQHPHVWRAKQIARNSVPMRGIATGFQALDALLPDQGWPAGGLTELMLPSSGIGELRLLAPALKQLSQAEHWAKRWIVWVNPPFTLHAPALVHLGIATQHILLVHPQTHKDSLWAVEHACKSGTCSTVLAWLDEHKLRPTDTRRLQLASKSGGTWTCLFRSHRSAQAPSMAELRLLLRPATADELQVDIVKRRGGWPVANVSLPIAAVTDTHQPAAEMIAAQLKQWRQQHQPVSTPPAEPSLERPLWQRAAWANNTAEVH